MKAIRDVAIAFILLTGLFGALLAIPMIAIILTIMVPVVVIGYLIYAALHDHHLSTEDEKNVEDRNEE